MTPMNKSIKCKMHVQASAVLGIKKSTIELLGVSNILSKRCTDISILDLDPLQYNIQQIYMVTECEQTIISPLDNLS